MGGAERVLIAAIAQIQLHRPNWELSVIQCEDGPLQDAVRSLGIPAAVCQLPNQVSRLGDNKPGQASSRWQHQRQVLDIARAVGSMPSFLLRLRRQIGKFAPDVVYSNGLKTHLISAAIRQRRYRLGWHAHDFYTDRPLAAKMLSVAAKRADFAVAISASIQQDLHRLSPSLPVDMVYNGIDLQRFSPGSSCPERLDSLSGLPPPAGPVVRCGLIATYARWKGQDVFIRTLQRLPHVRGYIIGGPIYKTGGSQWTRSELGQLAVQCGVSDRVGFIDFQQNTAQVYRDLDIVVHASINPEPFGLTIVEAMACGRPTVVAAAGGAAELIKDGVDAIGHLPGDVDSLAAALRRLNGDAEFRKSLGHAARRTALNKYSSDRFGEELVAVLARQSALPDLRR